ncbi:MAG: tetratricopeptide repeat protein [Bacteroidota bacterium]
MKVLLYILALQTTLYLASYAQATQAERELGTSFEKALALFQKEKHEAAQHYMEEYIRLHKGSLPAIEAQYYAALCAIRLDRPDGEERLYQFVQTYPYHHKTVLAYYELGNLCYAKQDYAKSLEYYLAVDTNQLAITKQCELQYRMAYAYLNEKKLGQALAYFNKIKEHDNPYTHAANYYAGYIALKDGDYETALADLNKASEHEAYQPVVPYLVLVAYYQQQRFQELLSYIDTVKNTAIQLKNEEEITLITAEAYFFLAAYPAAAQHYEAYLALQDSAATGEVLYRLAFALYKAEEDYKALKYFKEVAMQEDDMSQLGSYYAGLLYLKTNQQPLALAAFDKARQAGPISEVQAEATFQYAKVSYELGNFTSAIETLQKFKQSHTDNQHLLEADALLSEAYLRTNNYDLAITHIEGLADKPVTTRKVYQQVTLHKGSECFNNEAYDEAVRLLQKSLEYPYDQAVTTQAHLWLAETLSAQQAYEQAIPHYQQVLKEGNEHTPLYQQALYGLAYAYFNTGNYAQSLSNFIQYIAKIGHKMSSSWVSDALIRAADCYYAIKDYQQALQLYDKALSDHPAHAYYQRGLIYGILGDFTAAQTNLAAIFSKYAHTAYYEKALFEHARLALDQHDYPMAIKGFTTFIQQKPHSTLVPDALLNRAIAHGNLLQYAQAEKDYEVILRDYPTHPNAQSALLELPKLVTQEGKHEKMQQYLATYQAANPSSDSLERLTFETAKALFYSQNYQQAIEQLSSFIVNYPKSALVQEACFLVAEAYYRLGDDTQALIHYHTVAQETQHPFYNKILLRIASIAYKQQDFKTALAHYEQLKVCASSKKEAYYALEGIMKTSHALQQYDAVTQHASLIIEQGNITVNATQQAALYLGKAAMQRGERQKAIDHFKQVIERSKDSYAVEAQYLLAKMHYEAGDYKQALETLFELNKQFSTYQAWTNQAFLLIADNYMALDELFQAKATLQSIIEHATDEKVIASAKQKLVSLAQQADSTAKLAKAKETEEDNEFKTLDQ